MIFVLDKSVLDVWVYILNMDKLDTRTGAMAPAMAADAIDTLQDTACIVGIIDANTQRLKKRCPYKTKDISRSGWET